VRKYVTHLDRCKARKKGRKKGGRSDEFLSKERNAIERRRILHEEASKELTLKRSTIGITSDDAASSQETSSRKRARERADTDPEKLRQRQKRRIAEEDGIDAAVAITSDLYHDAPGHEDFAGGTGPS
jgi:hypothetical protein